MTQGNLFDLDPEPSSSSQQSQTDKSKPAPAAQPQFNWFFALRPSSADAQRIYDQMSGLLSAKGVTGKRISPERLHITLEFIGHDVSDAVLDQACSAADNIAFPALEARFDEVMTFSKSSGPLVLVGGKGMDQVRKLRTDLACAMADRGFNPPRSYEPHMTLCYDPRHRLARTRIEPVGFHAAEFALVKSYFGLSRHEVLRTWPLGG